MSTPPPSGPGAAPTGSPHGPVHDVLLGSIARRFYVEGRSKVEIAGELGLSRFKVARLLDEALASGVVRIEIGGRGDVDLEASGRLAEHLGLREALVVDTTGGGGAHDRRRLGQAAAAYVAETLAADDVLGLPWAREVLAMVRSLTSLPPVDVVQMCGAQAQPDEDSSAVEIVVRAARLAGTKGHVLYAPLIVDDPEAARAVLRQPSVAAAFAHARRVTRAVVGIGAWAPDASTIYDACGPRDREEARSLGVVGEIAGVFFDAEGAALAPPLSRRVITLGDDALRAVPRVCGVVSGVAKLPAVRAAVRGGIVDSLVVDLALGRALLGEA